MTRAAHHSPAQLAEQLGVKPCTLAMWRVLGTGPKFLKFGATKQARVVYPVSEVEAWEADKLIANTGQIIRS